VRQRSNLIILFGIAFFLIGGAIVYLVVTDDDDSGRSNATAVGEVTVFVAAEDIPANTTGPDVIEQGLLATDQRPAGSQPVGAITSAGGLDNQIFVVGVRKGDVITSSQLAVRSLSNISVPEGYDGVAVTLPYTNGGAGYVAPGDTINVYGLYGTSDQAAGLISGPEGANSEGVRLPRTELILTNVLVLDVSAQDARSIDNTQPDGQQAQQGSVSRQASQAPLTYLLALRPTDAERVVQVSEFAQLYFSLTADDAPPAGDTPGADGGSVLAPVSADSAAPRS
jgi:Flp pilus assembly protein CpaB